MTLSEACKGLELHFTRASQAAEEIKKLDIDTVSFESFEVVKTIDTFVYRFLKVQDYMGQKLFPIFLDELSEYDPSMPFRDVLNRLERLQILSSAHDWLRYREIRNTLTHDYPDNQEDIREGIKLALNAFEDIRKIFEKIKSYPV